MNKQWPNSELLARLLNREIPLENREAWDKDREYEDLARILAKSDNLEPPATKSVEQAWAQLQARIEAGEQPKVPADVLGSIDSEPSEPSAIVEAPVIDFSGPKPKRRRYVWMVAAAAAVVLLAIVIPSLQTPPASNQQWLTLVAAHEHREVQLPDGSTVILNAQSRLQYDPETWEQERVVRLEGEGYFDVAAGSRFAVEGPTVKATVLGTRFNVYDRHGKGKVKVFEGEVRTSLPESNWSQVLTAGEFIENNSTESLEVRKFEASPQPVWLSGQFDYPDGVPLYEVWQELERQYGVKLVYDDPAVDVEQSFYGSFYGPQSGEQNHEENLQQALRTVVKTMGYQYRYDSGQKIVITAR